MLKCFMRCHTLIGIPSETPLNKVNKDDISRPECLKERFCIWVSSFAFRIRDNTWMTSSIYKWI